MTANVYFFNNNHYEILAEDKEIRDEVYAVDLATEAMDIIDNEGKMELDYDTEYENDGETLAIIIKEVA